MKKRLLSLTLLTLIGSNSFAMNNDRLDDLIVEETIIEQINTEDELRKKIARTNNQSWAAAFFYGFFTPQKDRLYFAPTLLMSLLNVRNAVEIGTLNNIHECNSSIFSRGYRQITSLTKNSLAFALGSLLRYGLNQKLYPKNYWLQWALEPANWFTFALGSALYQSDYNRDLTKSYKGISFCVLNKNTLEEKDYQQLDLLLKNNRLNPNLAVETLFANQHSPIAFALKKNDTQLIEICMDCYKNNPNYLFSATPYTAALDWNNEQVFRQLLDLASAAHRAEPSKYGQKLIITFVDLVQNRMETIRNKKNVDSTFDPKQELTMLGLVFEVIKEMGHNPYPQKKYGSYNPINKLVAAYVELDKQNLLPEQNETPGIQSPFSTEKKFLNIVTKHFIQIGMPIYTMERTSEPFVVIGFIPPIPAPYELAQNNDEIRDFLKLVHRYNKRLLNCDQDQQELLNFIKKLQPAEQQDLFELAAKRGDINAINVFEKIDSKNYSRINAAKIAIKSRNKVVARKYIKSGSSIADNLDKYLQDANDLKFFIEEKEAFDSTNNKISKAFNQIGLDQEQQDVLLQILHDRSSQNGHKELMVSQIAELKKAQPLTEQIYESSLILKESSKIDK